MRRCLPGGPTLVDAATATGRLCDTETQCGSDTFDSKAFDSPTGQSKGAVTAVKGYLKGLLSLKGLAKGCSKFKSRC